MDGETYRGRAGKSARQPEGGSGRRSSDQPTGRVELPRKSSSEPKRDRTKTDTGGRGEQPQALGRTLEKELGKMTP